MVKNINDIIDSPVRLLNHVDSPALFGEKNQALTSFAIDDSIATTVGDSSAPPTFRLWEHDKTVVLGVPDARLPHFTDGVKFLKERGYEVVIRNSGGLAVILDSGVLNLSIILPNHKDLSIHASYDLMVDFIQLLFKDYTAEIKAYEIVGSYCPGDYDLSINGVKFAGISQRRVRDGVAVQIYLDITGNSKQRAQLIQDFYHIGKNDEATAFTYPEVNPAVMGSLSKLLQTELTVPMIIRKIESLLQKDNETTLILEEAVIFQKRFEQMQKRNAVIAVIK